MHPNSLPSLTLHIYKSVSLDPNNSYISYFKEQLFFFFELFLLYWGIAD